MRYSYLLISSFVVQKRSETYFISCYNLQANITHKIKCCRLEAEIAYHKKIMPVQYDTYVRERKVAVNALVLKKLVCW
ncbi:hypothetical protein GOP47_0017512 [Adiantum capillus-veneris]|uniref:Uncharacterized protein n=1 Tax=Adiantum capillus-veneris TaxID=13818 RepID=A0A9D4Z9R6_ADICA|nr:hypothetical protein GOP47_0017512 [Adiantum capillus-veneris]